MKLPTLYKEKNGKTLFWSVSTTNNQIGIPCYVVQHGYVGGKTQTTQTEVPVGKNIGRANETTAAQQCELEAQSEWNKHKDRKGYVENLTVRSNEFKPVKPMLAHTLEDYENKVIYPCYIQPKLDGMRCLAHVDDKGDVRLFSRQSNEFHVIGHIKSELKKIGLKNIILDGELYVHGWEFEKISSAVKRDIPNELTPQVEYHVYDTLNKQPFERRLYCISSLLNNSWSKNGGRVKCVETSMARNRTDVEEWHKTYTASGYEGIMLRNPQGLYTEDKRSWELLKVKKWKDAEYKIIGAHENKGKLKGTCTFKLQTKTGEAFDAMPEGTFEKRAKYWEDWQSGEIGPGLMGTVKFFCYTNGDVPRFPVFQRIRGEE